MNKLVYTEADLGEILDQLGPLVLAARVVTLKGPLGAGKTTLIRALLVQLGVESSYITSPTFSYVHQYQLPSGRDLFHFDLYRLASLEDFYALGFEEYLYRPDSISFIEWPEIVWPLIADEHLAVELDYSSDLSNRLISWDIRTT